jgi:long-chain acyl-CoA synthetase
MKRAHAFGAALVRTLDLTAHDSNVLILLNDSIGTSAAFIDSCPAHVAPEYLISDLALSTHSIPSFTISSLRLLIPIIESNPTSAIITSTEFLPHLLEVIHEANEHGRHNVIVVGELDANHAVEGQINWHSFAALEAEGVNAEAPAPRAPGPSFYAICAALLLLTIGSRRCT